MSANVVSKSGIHTGSGSASVIVSGENTLLLLTSYGVHFDYIASATWSIDSGSFEYASSSWGAEFWWLKSPAGGIGNVNVVCDEGYENIHWCILSLNNIDLIDTLRTTNSSTTFDGMGQAILTNNTDVASIPDAETYSASRTYSGIFFKDYGCVADAVLVKHEYGEATNTDVSMSVVGSHSKIHAPGATVTLAVTHMDENDNIVATYLSSTFALSDDPEDGYSFSLSTVVTNFDVNHKLQCSALNDGSNGEGLAAISDYATASVTIDIEEVDLNPFLITLNPTENQDFCVAILGSDSARSISPLETRIASDSHASFEYSNAMSTSKTMRFSLVGVYGYVLKGIALKTILTTLFTYILQRVGNTFLYVDKASLPQRLECSLSYPLLSVEDNIISLDIIDTYNLSVYPQNGIISLGEVGDFKYTRVASGVALENKLLVSLSGTVQTADISNISSPLYLDSFSTIFTTESGENTHAIETSNYLSESQYIFVATSGDNPKFYQQDDEPFREESLSLGSSPVITIRLDDRI